MTQRREAFLPISAAEALSFVMGPTTFKLDMSAISQKLLVGRAQLWSTEANCFVYSAVLVDSPSEVTMAVVPFFMNGVTKGSVRLSGTLGQERRESRGL